MSKRLTLLLVAPLVAVSVPSARAQGDEPPLQPAVEDRPGAAESVMTSSGSSMQSYGTDWLVNPLKELEVGANLRFLTSAESPLAGSDELRFTDVGLFHVAARYSTGGRLEIAGGLDLLAKQPSELGEPVFYGGDVGARFALKEKWALWAHGAAGPVLGDQGNWGEVAAGVQARTSIDETIRFQASLGGAGTQLFMGEDSGRPWFAEVSVHGEAVLRSPRGEFAGWLGSDYRVPVAHDGGTLDLDPQVRLGFQIGALIGYVDHWDLYTLVSFVDRGDIQDPTTTLPLLDGGFDQTQIIFGAARRFDLASDDEKRALQMAY